MGPPGLRARARVAPAGAAIWSAPTIDPARGAVYVDIFAHTSSAFRHHPGRYFAKDHYHPNDAGYGLWATAVAPAVPVVA